MELLAVDGGQSAIRVRHSSAAADVELEGVSRLEGDTVAAVSVAVESGWRASGALPTERAFLGLTTAPTDPIARAQLCATVSDAIGAREVWLADDAVTSHAGALSLGWGVSLTAGTGVACLALAPAGSPRIVGGHGYLVGDEGGGFWIGSAGLRAVLKAADGRGPETDLRPAAERHFGGLQDVGDRLHSSPRPVDAIARFAPLVVAAADRGDAVAEGVVAAAADELVLLARAAVATVDAGGEPVPLALGGRLLREGRLRARVERTIASEVAGCVVRSAAGTPLDGAMQLARAGEGSRLLEQVYAWARAS